MQKKSLDDEDSISIDLNKIFEKRRLSQVDVAKCIQNNIPKPNELFKIARERQSVGENGLFKFVWMF